MPRISLHNPREPHYGIVVLLLILSISISFTFRLYFSNDILPPPARMQGETTQAYRYVRMVSGSNNIPETDMMVMHPSGMDTSENSILEEYIAGHLHRITGGDLDSFLRIFCLLFPLLTIPAIYLWMRSSGFPLVSSLIGSTLYGFLFPALLRARGGSLYRETVALPLIVFLGWAVESALQNKGRKCRLYSIVAGLLLFISLAAWKVTAFISVFLLIYLHIRNLRNRIPVPLALSLSAVQIAASLVLSHMRHDVAILNPASVLALFLIPAVLIRKEYRKYLSFAAIPTIVVVTAFLGRASTEHVSAVIIAKFRHLFSHPGNPLLLSPDARLFWVSGYTSPTLAQIVLLFGIPIIASIAGIPEFFRKYRNTLLFWFLPLSLGGYLFFDRLLVFLAVASIPLLALAMKRKIIIVPVLYGLILVQSLFPAQIANALSKTVLHLEDGSSLLSDEELDSLFGWMHRSTEPDDAVLAYWHISGLISAYAERPVVTHTFFENTDNRHTIQEFSRMLYLPEDSLVRFMSGKQCSLVLYQADFLLDRSPSGLLYLAGLTEVPTNCSGYLMHYSPEKLEHLSLVFQTPSLRVFSLDSAIHSDPLDRMVLFEERYADIFGDYNGARNILSDPIYASGRLADEGIEFGEPDKLSMALLLGLQSGADSEIIYDMLNDLIQMYIIGSYSIEDVADDIHSYLYCNGSSGALRLLLARLYGAEGMFESAMEEYETIMELHPNLTEAEHEYELLTDGKNR